MLLYWYSIKTEATFEFANRGLLDQSGTEEHNTRTEAGRLPSPTEVTSSAAER